MPSGICPPTNTELGTAAAQPGRWFNAKALDRVPGNGDSEEKSAKGWVALGRSDAEGTNTSEDGIPWRMRRPSYEVKKNVRSLTIGPPHVHPNWSGVNWRLAR